MAFFKRRIVAEDIAVRDDGAIAAAPSADQDPVYGHVHGNAASVTASTVIFTPLADHKYAEICATADIWIRTDDAAAVVPIAGMTNGVPIFVGAGVPKVVPVKPGVPVRAISASGSAVLVVIAPLEAR